MESIVPKINFLKNENCIFTFFKFWNIDLNFIFLFFWNANFNSNLSFNWNWNKIWIYGVRLWRQRTFVWLVDVCFVLCLILFNDFYFERWLFDKQNGLLENGLLKYFKGVNMIIGLMMAASTKTLQFISVAVLKIIFKRHSGKAGLWTYGLDSFTLGTWTMNAWTLQAGTLGLWTHELWRLGRLDSRRLDSGRLGTWTLDAWNLDTWSQDDWYLDSRRLGSVHLLVWTMDV